MILKGYSRFFIVGVLLVGMALAGCQVLPPAPVVLPSAPPPPVASPTEAPTSAPPNSTATGAVQQTQEAQIYLVALEDAGRSGQEIGCGDSLVPVTVNLPAANTTEEAIRNALDELLTAGDKYATGAGLYNALKNSHLTVDQVALNGNSAVVSLFGNLSLGGVCDNPRLQAQLEQTVLQFPQVDRVQITINGRPLADLLSGR